MKRRFKLNKQRSKRNFNRGNGVHRKNATRGGHAMRGGIRL